MVLYSNNCICKQFFTFKSVKALEEWKKHLLRSVNQDRARSHVIENLSDGEVLIERDWAMKLLPMMYRESQSGLPKEE